MIKHEHLLYSQSSGIYPELENIGKSPLAGCVNESACPDHINMWFCRAQTQKNVKDMFFKNHWDVYRNQWEFQDPKMEVRSYQMLDYFWSYFGGNSH